MIEELERLTREYFDVETEHNPHSHLDYVVAQVESGDPISTIASSIAVSLKEPIRRQMLSDYLHQSFTDAKARLQSARPVMGEAMAEDAINIVDTPNLDKTQVAHASLRARMRESLAKMFNPDLAPNRQPTLQFNIGTLHLSALRAPSAPHVHVRLIEQPEGQTGALMAPTE